MARSHSSWVETAPPQVITVRRRALRELALDTIVEEGLGQGMAGAPHFLSEPSSAADQSLRSGVGLHQQHRHTVAFAQ
jgi:hypothetical protein